MLHPFVELLVDSIFGILHLTCCPTFFSPDLRVDIRSDIKADRGDHPGKAEKQGKQDIAPLHGRQDYNSNYNQSTAVDKPPVRVVEQL
ncbi:MAG: hypothetical protein ABR512_12650 [Desulfopila sp.]